MPEIINYNTDSTIISRVYLGFMKNTLIELLQNNNFNKDSLNQKIDFSLLTQSELVLMNKTCCVNMYQFLLAICIQHRLYNNATVLDDLLTKFFTETNFQQLFFNKMLSLEQCKRLFKINTIFFPLSKTDLNNLKDFLYFVQLQVKDSEDSGLLLYHYSYVAQQCSNLPYEIVNSYRDILDNFYTDTYNLIQLNTKLKNQIEQDHTADQSIEEE